jgi:pyruvate formate lyase activating enzyme
MSDLTGIIFNIMRYSIYDGPGIRTTVFLKGCPASCCWCHNPEAISDKVQLMYREDRCCHCGDCAAVCPNGAISVKFGNIVTDREICRLCGACADVCCAEARELAGRIMTVGEVMEEISKDIPFFEESGGGVTFSGGEPLQQHEFLQEILKDCKRRSIKTAVDTSGHAPPEVLRRIGKWTDLFLFDLKLMDNVCHRKYTGITNDTILQNLKELAVRGKPIIIRVPLVPGINDSLEGIRGIGRFLKTLPNVREIELLPYHAAGVSKYKKLGMECSMPDIPSISTERLERFIVELQEHGIAARLGHESSRH